jgi:hypothetical protein
MLAVLFKILPKVGPLRAINFKEPTPRTEDLYFKSVDQTFTHFRTALIAVKDQDLQPANIDLDSGKPTARGEYPLADRTYRDLLGKLANDHFENTDEALRQDILRFYERFGVTEQESRIDRCDAECWRKTWIEVNQLRAVALLDAADRAQPRRPTKTSPGVEDSAIASSARLNPPEQ